MKYYRLKEGAEGWGAFPRKVYPETAKLEPKDYCTISDYVNDWPKDWQEVTKEEYDAQEGKTKEFVLPTRWCIKDCEEVSEYAANRFDCGRQVGRHHLCVNEDLNKYWFEDTEFIKEQGYKKITKAQFKKYVLKEAVSEEVSEEVVEVLPAKWCVKVTKENADTLTTWKRGISKGFYNDTAKGYSFINQDGDGSGGIYGGRTEITFDQFQRLVLKQQPKVKQPKVVKVKTAPERISFYVKYTSEFTEDLYNKLMDWCKINVGGHERGWTDSHEGLIRNEFFVADNYGLNGSSFNNKDIMSYGVDNNRQSCKEEYSVKQAKELINYVEPIKEPVMKATAQTFKITSKSKALLEAMWKELLTIGYEERSFTPQNNYSGESCYISSNIEKVNLSHTIDNFKELYCGSVSDNSDRTFNLPEQYNEAIEFATQQLAPKLWVVGPKFKVGDWIIFDGKSHKSGLYQLGEKRVDGEFNDTKGQYRNTSDSAYRLATPEEIKEHENNLLLEEAKRRYPKGTIILSAYSGSRYPVADHSALFIASDGSIDNGGSGYLYSSGKWAEIVKDAVIIKGYDCNYTPDSVSFGCQTFSKQTALDLVRLMDLGVIESKYSSELKEVAKHFSN